MKLRFWQRETVCHCEPTPIPEPAVCALSPARLLAKSLTDPETRREWVKSYPERIVGLCGYVRYRNEGRDITVTRYWSGYGGGVQISTPFTLSEAEKRIVGDALTKLERWQCEEIEKEVLARLIAPASVDRSGEADETSTKIEGSAEGESAVTAATPTADAQGLVP